MQTALRASTGRVALTCPRGVRPAVALSLRQSRARPSRAVGRKQLSVRADVSVDGDSLGSDATTVRNLAWGSFWVQLPLTVVSASILFFATFVTPQVQAGPDVSRYFTFAGVVLSFISTFFAHGFLTLARRAISGAAAVKRSYVVQSLVRNSNINLAGIGAILIGLQASVGTLVSKTMLAAANAPYAAPQPANTLVSLDVFSLQASTNVLLAHFLSIVFANLILSRVNRVGAQAA